MTAILIYTSPARGHLFPVVGVALELRARGHTVHVRTLAPEVERIRSLGLSADPIAPEIEARELDDWRASNPLQAIDLAMRTFGDRAVAEVDDLLGAVRETRAEALLIDTNSWGAQAVAEASGVPWAVFQPYFTLLPEPGVPPFGPGLARSTGRIGRARDRALGTLLSAKLNRVALPGINAPRSRLGLERLTDIAQLPLRPPLVLYFTAEPFEYPRKQWPETFRLVGPATWAPPSATPEWLDQVDRPIALVTCSTERQSDRALIDSALASLPDQGLFVVATSAAHAPDERTDAANPHYRVERFLAHDPILDRAEVVVCHGGMGITQRALSHGVPVVVVPFGRDQLEVARRVEHAGAGVRLMPKRLKASTLASAVQAARTMRGGAQQIAEAFAHAGGEQAAADAFESLAQPSKATRPAERTASCSPTVSSRDRRTWKGTRASEALPRPSRFP
jgi:MGT family glycosyltransferase